VLILEQAFNSAYGEKLADHVNTKLLHTSVICMSVSPRYSLIVLHMVVKRRRRRRKQFNTGEGCSRIGPCVAIGRGEVDDQALCHNSI
jgi:hypothetical protein